MVIIQSASRGLWFPVIMRSCDDDGLADAAQRKTQVATLATGRPMEIK
jgi:hypothetical protein